MALHKKLRIAVAFCIFIGALSGVHRPALAACTSPDGIAGGITWNGTDSVIWCDGTNWYALKNSVGSSGSAGYIQFSNGSGGFSNSGTTAGQQLFWDDTNKRLGIGPAAPGYMLDINSNGTGAAIGFTVAVNSGQEPLLLGQRSRGTLSAKTAVTASQHLLRLLGRGYDGTSAYTGGGSILITAAETYTPSTGAAYIAFNTTPTGSTTQSERMRIDSAGNVGIGTATPVAKLDIAGTIVSRAANVASGGAVDLTTSNTVTLASVGGYTITLSNMVHGGNYTLVVQDTTSRTYTFSGCNTSKFRPANAATMVASQTIYNILTLYNGATYDCYITWATGYL